MVKAGNSVEPRVELIYGAMVQEAMKAAPVVPSDDDLPVLDAVLSDDDPFPTVQGEESA